jgi:hypothetical protein
MSCHYCDFSPPSWDRAVYAAGLLLNSRHHASFRDSFITATAFHAEIRNVGRNVPVDHSCAKRKLMCALRPIRRGHTPAIQQAFSYFKHFVRVYARALSSLRPTNDLRERSRRASACLRWSYIRPWKSDDRIAAAVAAARPARGHRARPKWPWRVSVSRRQRSGLRSCHDPNNCVGQRADADTQCQHGNRAEGDKADAGYRFSRWRFPRSALVHIPLTPETTYCFASTRLKFPNSEIFGKSFRDFWRQEFVCRLNVRHAANSAFKNIQVGQVVKSRRQPSEPHDLSAAWATRRP